ncbi:hypothetical protein AYWB_205 [Aster yellows witches'-broom phytoplasma AYWB]|uniref:Uncharacterized protein n=1 Tax=Aster yellows witches'-broom phytoplasma (strain AYWB) TaxID=322098 RepID=Q2NJS1_AYWBP|nr:hypothetical protein [Aster yellows witches'-broom phytoplasma]ABC65322.1 hypothetical protein AYWB_205 [Aster yellows witches'-broom phytoplasma AYWB]
MKQEIQTVIDEYTKITEELELKRQQITDEIKNEQPKNITTRTTRNKTRTDIDEEIKTIKEELKQINPNYTRAQKKKSNRQIKTKSQKKYLSQHKKQLFL